MESLVVAEGGSELLDEVGPLWEELSRHHQAVAPGLAQRLARVTWERRRDGLLVKAREGHLRVDLVSTPEGETIAYCVTTVGARGAGEVESIFVRDGYRCRGIGDALMKRALAWLDDKGARTRVIGVVWGNDRALGFYRRYGFVPATILLREVDDDRP